MCQQRFQPIVGTLYQVAIVLFWPIQAQVTWVWLQHNTGILWQVASVQFYVYTGILWLVRFSSAQYWGIKAHDLALIWGYSCTLWQITSVIFQPSTGTSWQINSDPFSIDSIPSHYRDIMADSFVFILIHYQYITANSISSMPIQYWHIMACLRVGSCLTNTDSPGEYLLRTRPPLTLWWLYLGWLSEPLLSILTACLKVCWGEMLW